LLTGCPHPKGSRGVSSSPNGVLAPGVAAYFPSLLHPVVDGHAHFVGAKLPQTLYKGWAGPADTLALGSQWPPAGRCRPILLRAATPFPTDLQSGDPAAEPLPMPTRAQKTHGGSRSRMVQVAAVGALISALLLPACGGSKGQTIRTEPTGVARETDPVRRGTIGSIASTTANLPVLVSGYGLVVGLDGTGGGVLPENIAATMVREMQLKGIGPGMSVTQGPLMDPTTGRPKTADEVLTNPNVAVVLVQAVISRAAPDGFEFDVSVRALNATSLRGGLLWTTDLRLGPPSSFGRVQTRRLGQAYGPVYTNPFLEPDSEAAANQPVGRVLGGGVVTDPLAVQIALDTPSHVRAAQIVAAVNSRFRAARFDPGPIARGRSDSLVDVLIPHRWRHRPDEFISLLEHVQLEYQFPAEHAQRIAESLRRDPGIGQTATTMLVALGDPALPTVRDLYVHEDPQVRFAGLAAGARLGDERAEEGLLEFARHADGIQRLESLNMLAMINGGPVSQSLLRELASSGPATVRIAAYAAIAERAERAAVAANPGDAFAEERAEMQLLSRGIGGFDRRTVGGDSFDPAASKPKFVLDRVPWGEPLIFVTQQGRPRVVLMGEQLEIRKPTFISLWDGRLTMVADSTAEPLRISHRSGSAPVPRRLDDVPTDIDRLLDTLARVPTRGDPRPGLGLSYGEIVSVLAGLAEDGSNSWAFTTERDTLTAALAEARTGPASRVRPETSADLPVETTERTGEERPRPAGTPQPTRPQVVPLNTAPPAEEGKR
jgi:flagellar basal body P-ring protein FlgI